MKKKAKNSIRKLYTFDNLPVLRSMDSDTVDLIYLDPPFNSGKQWENPVRAGGKKAIMSFKDTWTLSDIHVDEAWALGRQYPETIPLIESLYQINGGSWKAYLIYMGVRLAEMRRVLKPTGSIYFHCDPVMSHGVKLLMDSIFGGQSGGNFRNEIIWRMGWVSGYKTQKKGFIRNHDVLLYYVNDSKFTFCKEYIPYADGYVRRDGKPPTGKGIPIEDTWNCSAADILDSIMIKSFSKEKTGYPTQKPLALLERIIKASSNEGDLVLDPFCGCATTCVAAERLGRQWIGIDLAEEAKNLVLDRLKKETELPLTNPEKIVEHLTAMPKRADLRKRTDNAILKPRLYKQQNGKCAAPCGENGEGRAVEMDLMDFDHIIAKSRGGQDEDDNLQLLCRTCNTTKGGGGMERLRRRIFHKKLEESMAAARKKWEEEKKEAEENEEE